MRIAVCGISKSWRERNWGEIQKSIHLINMKAVAKPDIHAFLGEHPMLENGCGEGDIGAGEYAMFYICELIALKKFV